MSATAKKNKTIMPYVTALCIPVLVMLLVFFQREIFPFGGKSFLRTDLYHQYAPFHQMMRDALRSGKDLTYTWDVGLGTNMLSLYAYYLASPFNWLLFLWPANYVIEFITYGIVLKMGIASVTFTYYLKKHCNKDSWTPVLFGILYSLSGYFAAYSWNTMWLDCLFLFPLVILGLESLVKEKRFFLYTWSLALCILTNYYISIMICIFLVIYFFVQMAIQSDAWIVRDEDGFSLFGPTLYNFCTRGLTFAFFSLLAGGMACVLLMPVYKAFDLTASSNSTFPKTPTSYFSIFDMLSRHLIDVDIHIGLDHWPNIFCGVGTLVMLPLYVLNKSVKPKEKVLSFSLLLFFLLSFSLNILNYIWHGFHYPNSLPARQSFIYIFLILVMGYKGFLAIREVKRTALIGSFAGVAAFAILAEKLITDDFLEWDSCYLTIVFAGIYTILAWIYQKRKLAKDMLFLLVITVLAIEMTINTSETSVTTVTRSNYVSEDPHMDSLIDIASDLENGGFFRMEKVSTRTKNDGAWLDYHSGSIFSSSANAKVTAFYKKMGMEGSTNSYSMNGSTLFMDCLLGIKYVTSKSAETETELRKLCAQTEMVNLYANTYALPLGFLVDTSLKDNLVSASSPIENQNRLAKEAAGVSNLFSQVPTTTVNSQEVRIVAQQEGYLYAYVTKGNKVTKVTVNSGSSEQIYSNLDRGYLIDLGYHTTGDMMTLSTEDEGTLIVTAYLLDEEKLAEVYNTLNESPMVVDRYDSTHVYAHINASRDGLVFTSIPMEGGWKVFVDGKEVEPELFQETFLSIPVTQGSHTLEFRYEVEGLSSGLLLTAISLALFLLSTLIVYVIIGPFSSKKKEMTVRTQAADETDFEGDPENPDNFHSDAKTGTGDPLSDPGKSDDSNDENFDNENLNNEDFDNENLNNKNFNDEDSDNKDLNDEHSGEFKDPDDPDPFSEKA